MVINFKSISLKMMTKMVFITRIMMMIMKMTMMMMMMNMMIEIKMAITWPIFKLSAPNFAWQFIQLVPID